MNPPRAWRRSSSRRAPSASQRRSKPPPVPVVEGGPFDTAFAPGEPTIIVEPPAAPAPVMIPVRRKAGLNAEQYFALLHKALGDVQNQTWADETYTEALQAKDRGDKATIKGLLKETHSYVRFEWRLTTQINPAWAQVQKAWIDWVAAENAKGHLAEKAMAIAFTDAMIAMHARIQRSFLWEAGADEMDKVLKDLGDLVIKITSFAQHWCAKCGAPVFEIAPKNGKPPFMPKDCRDCFTRKTDQEEPEEEPTRKPRPSDRKKAARHAAARELRATNGPQKKSSGGRKKKEKKK